MKKVLNWVLAIFLVVLLGIWLFVDLPLLSPLGEGSFSQFLSTFPHFKTQKIVYGFLPYWNLDEVVIQPELTHLAYFALSIGEDGEIATRAIGGGTEPGYYRLQSEELLTVLNQAKGYESETQLVFTQFDNDTIESFLNSEAAQQVFIDELDALLLAYPFGGINIDIEYAGEADVQLRENYTSFIALVSQHLDETYEDIELTIDMYASAASKQLLWEVEELGSLVDYIIVMAYDFHRSSSPNAGPVAPLFEKEASWDESINGYLREFSKVVPTKKMLLGIPFYGYEWQTTSTEPESFTFPRTGAIASYGRVKELLANKEELGITEHWEENALAPYLSYSEGDEHYLVYYENPLSVAYKLEYVNQLDLAGIAIWSLGYEGNSRDLWNSIDQVLKIKN